MLFQIIYRLKTLIEKIKIFLQKTTLTETQKAVLLLSALVIFWLILPNHTIDPYQLFNPRRFVMLILLIAGIQFSGYITTRLFGNKIGMVFTGFFGGLVSSTAVFLTLPQLYKDNHELLRPTISAALFATIGMLVEFSLILLAISPVLFNVFFWPLTTMILMGILSAIIVNRKRSNIIVETGVTNPLHFKSVLKLATLIFFMIMIISLTVKYMDVKNVELVSFVGGLFELHSVSLATSILFVDHKLSLIDAKTILFLALSGAYISKLFILWVLGRNSFSIICSALLCLMLASGSIIFFIT